MLELHNVRCFISIVVCNVSQNALGTSTCKVDIVMSLWLQKKDVLHRELDQKKAELEQKIADDPELKAQVEESKKAVVKPKVPLT